MGLDEGLRPWLCYMWTQMGCLKPTGVSLGRALNCVCSTCVSKIHSIDALSASEESVRTLFRPEVDKG